MRACSRYPDLIRGPPFKTFFNFARLGDQVVTVVLPVAPTLLDVHRSAIEDANRWRGHCIESYARLEWGAHRTIEALPKVPGSKMPTVFGERLKRLTALFSETGLQPRPKIYELLIEAGPLLAMRNLVVHGVGSVFVDAHGHWLWYYRFQPSKAGAQLETGCILQKDANTLEADLQKRVQKLTGLLAVERNKASV